MHPRSLLPKVTRRTRGLDFRLTALCSYLGRVHCIVRLGPGPGLFFDPIAWLIRSRADEKQGFGHLPTA
jgi:hypothetical protein